MFNSPMKTSAIARPWLPLLVALASISATLVVWNTMVDQQRTQTERVVKLATYSIRADMVADMNLRILGLVGIAKLWDIWEKPRKSEFELHTTLFISHDPGCVAVGWVDMNNRVNWVVPVDGDARIRELILSIDDEGRKALKKTLETRDAVVAKSVQLTPDEKFLPVWVPVFVDNEAQGFIVGVFRVHTLLDDVTADHADLGYEVRVSEGANTIYSLSGAIPRNEWAQEAIVPLPGSNWRLEIWPSAKALPDTISLPRGMLLGGVLVSVLLSLTVYLAQKARLWARHVEAANSELVKENAERRTIEESLHRLSARLLQLQDEERRHIARELHDSTAQTLFVLSIKLRLISESESPGDAESKQLLGESRQLADQCLAEMRTMSYLLHPPSLDDLGLLPACRSLAKGFTERSGILVDMELPAKLDRLPLEVETALFRVIQESLSNIHRHSGSKNARIQLSQDQDEIRLEVSDQGRGFVNELLDQVIDNTRIGVGIAGMQARLRQLGGRLEIRSTSKGTTVIATLPLQGKGTPDQSRTAVVA